MKLRPQFSLRMILLLMAAVGVGLTIFRWPWVEKDFAYQTIADEVEGDKATQIAFERRITYHRDWRGRPVKHGLEQSLRNGQVWHEANYYDGQLSGPRRVWNLKNQLAIEATYLGGKLHGPFRCGDGQQRNYVGQYAHDQMTGEWRISDHRNANELTPADFEWYVDANGQPQDFHLVGPVELSRITGNWRRGKLHGPMTWRTLDGELLNSAEYLNGEIVAWNGQPLVSQFWGWLRTQNNPRLEAWLSAATASNWQRVHGAPFDELILKMGAGNSPDEWLVIYLECKIWQTNIKTDGALVTALCEFAARDGLGFDYRYGALWMVPRAADPSPPFVDHTGVDKVEFAAGSLQAREWTNIMEVERHYGTVGSSLQHVLKGSSINLDLSALPKPDRDQLYRLKNRNAVFLRTQSRRDVVGLILYRTGLRCEQRGDTLVILPRWSLVRATAHSNE